MLAARHVVARAALNAARAGSRRAVTTAGAPGASRAASSSLAGDLFGLAGCAAAGVAIVASSTVSSASADVLHPPAYPWSHTGWFDKFDHAAIRRGHQVFQQVCSSCHGLERLAYRNLVGVAYTEEEAKAIAAGTQVEDGPNDAGEMFLRPGKLSDYIHSPYKNEQKARAANNGALPPDLSLIVKARHGGPDYIFALLTGYLDEPPAGVELAANMHANPYFPGMGIGMARALYDGGAVYEDGTPATTSQMAKDVTVFLAWVSEPEADERKRMGVKALVTLGLLAGATFYWKRLKWTLLKSRHLMRK